MLLRQARGANLRIGERYARLRPVVRAGPRISQDVIDRDVGVVDRHVGKATAGGDVADGPESITDSHVVIRLQQTRRRIKTYRFEADVFQV